MSLYEWESFYVIIGSSAAALTGLMFVVIALGAEARTIGDAEALKAFATPTIVQFCAVLLLAAIVSTPRQTAGSLRACFLVCGIGGVAFTISALSRARRQKSYEPETEDWVWHGALPLVAYGSIFVTAMFFGRHAQGGLYFMAAAALLLLYIGIHNAWDAAVWMTTTKRAQR